MASLALVKLVNRRLIKVSGPDCYPYLQSLFCNDLRILYEPDRLKPKEHAHVSPNVLSSFMLNAQGRVICDLLVYRTPYTRYQCEFTPPGQAKEPDELLLECDSNLATGLANTLYGYRVRRKIQIELMNNQSVWCLYPQLEDTSDLTSRSNNDTVMSISSQLAKTKETISNDMTLVYDPRLDLMGMRILKFNNDTIDDNSSIEFENLKAILQSQIDLRIQRSSERDYIVHRYKLGVGEGTDDHPEGACLPLESNADLLNSVSFDKGCYLGQELTARIHFTGVVRKRLMPILIHRETKQKDLTPYCKDSQLIDENSGKKIGVLRHVVRDHALALLRNDLISETTKLIHDGTMTRVSFWKPFWWSHNHTNEKNKKTQPGA